MNVLKCCLSQEQSWYLGQSEVVTYHTHSHTDWHAFPHTDLMVGTHVPVFYHRLLKPADSCAAAAALSHSRTVTWTTDKEVNTKHEVDINYRWQLWFIVLWYHFQNCVQGGKNPLVCWLNVNFVLFIHLNTCFHSLDLLFIKYLWIFIHIDYIISNTIFVYSELDIL